MGVDASHRAAGRAAQLERRIAALEEALAAARTREADAQRVAEQALAEARHHLAAIVESSDDAIVALTLQGTITSWNQGATRIFGHTAAEMIGRPITTIIPPELHHEEADILARIRAGERVEHYETVRLAKGGARLDISLTVSPVRDRSGTVVGASKVARDITERKLALRALAEADRRKDEFLAILAHELRNPLAPIRYALSITKEQSADETQRRRAEAVIERQVAHMARLLDDLLDVSRIARGRVELRKKWIDLTSAIGAAIDTARPLLDAKGQALVLDLPREPLRLEADPVRVSQILSNLLTNAAKYSGPGAQVQLRAWREGGEIGLAVRDDGIGISADMLPKLFTMFTQAEPARQRSEGGLGIGLALVRAFAELHGGRAEARSAGPGKGSEFRVWLPVGTAPPRADAPGAIANDRRASRLRVLVADDNEDNAETCAALVRLWGHEVRVARDGDEALAIAEAYRPQVAVLDIGMPLMSGYQVAEALRASPWGAAVSLIAVTGWGQDEDRRKAAAAGFDHHLSKPVDPERLREMLELVPALD